MTRVLLYSDEPILAKGLESVLRQVDGFDLLPTCGSVASLVEQMAQGSPELVLMDLTPEVTFAVLNELKHAMMSCKIVLWVNSISTELAFQASSVEMEFTHSTILQLIMACFSSFSTAKVTSGVRSISTSSGEPWAICSTSDATLPQVGSRSKPSTWRSTDSSPLAKIGSSL